MVPADWKNDLENGLQARRVFVEIYVKSPEQLIAVGHTVDGRNPG